MDRRSRDTAALSTVIAPNGLLESPRSWHTERSRILIKITRRCGSNFVSPLWTDVPWHSPLKEKYFGSSSTPPLPPGVGLFHFYQSYLRTRVTRVKRMKNSLASDNRDTLNTEKGTYLNTRESTKSESRSLRDFWCNGFDISIHLNM